MPILFIVWSQIIKIRYGWEPEEELIKLFLILLAEAMQISSLSIPGDISSAECNQGAAVYDE